MGVMAIKYVECVIKVNSFNKFNFISIKQKKISLTPKDSIVKY